MEARAARLKSASDGGRRAVIVVVEDPPQVLPGRQAPVPL